MNVDLLSVRFSSSVILLFGIVTLMQLLLNGVRHSQIDCAFFAKKKEAKVPQSVDFQCLQLDSGIFV